ncbi:MAG: TonB-dependent receptor domain-containing protein, partial [Cytophagales bacterium]
MKTYFGLEPRLSVRYATGPESSFKLGYNRIHQFIHLVTNSTAVTPVDIWQPSGYYFKPQVSDQVSIGYFKDLKGKKYGFSLEAFYKTISNVLDFKDGAQLILNKHLETDLLQGTAHSYGAEIQLSKNVGKFTWSVNYTYSRAF